MPSPQVFTLTQINPVQIFRQLAVGLLVICCIAYSGLYYEKYIKYDNAFITNVDPPYEKATWNTPGNMEFRKGVNTIKESIFSFPIESLLTTPYNENGSKNNLLHRQNIWTQMLGQFTNHVFERHPSKWSSVNNDMENFARANILAHILLILIVILGIFFQIFLSRKKISLIAMFHLFTVLCYIFFAIHYAVKFRDFSFMKVVFLYPAYASLIYFSVKGFSIKNYTRLVSWFLLACVAMYEINFLYLVRALIT